MPSIIDVSRGNSFFSFIREYCVCENDAIHRLCSLMRKMKVETAIVEKLSSSHSEILEECEALKERNCRFLSAYRVIFLSDRIKTFEELTPDLNFLSCAYLINYHNKDEKIDCAYLYKAIVIRPSYIHHPVHGDIPLSSNYVHIYKTFPCSIGTPSNGEFTFHLSGTYFCQQNGVTSVCAHAALCMIMNNLDPDIFNTASHGEITTNEINLILEQEGMPFRKTVSTPGLKTSQIKTILRKYGLKEDTDYNFVTDPLQNRNFDYNDWVYNYVESKCPVLLCFNAIGIEHVVPVLGHTLNTDLWRPEAEKVYSSSVSSRIDLNKYTPSSAWVDNLIIHDDNFGPYFHLSVDALKRATLPKLDPSFRATYGLAIVPKDVCTTKLEAESASIVVIELLVKKWLNSGGEIDRWSFLLLKNRPTQGSDTRERSKIWVIRSLLTTRDVYLASLMNQESFEGETFSSDDLEIIGCNLPNRFWLSEVTLPELYTADQTKIIDFCYSCDLPPSEHGQYEELYKRWIQVRFPNILMVRGDEDISFPLSVGSHFPLLQFESASKPVED